MNGTLRLVGNTLAFADVGGNSNPTKRFVDWSVQRSYSVANPQSTPITVDPGATVTLFNSLRTLATDSSSQFKLELSTLASDRYRLAYQVGESADPQIRILRGDAATSTVTIVVNANQTVTMTSTLALFNTAVAGDIVFISDTTTGDAASPFDSANVGYWTIVAKIDANTAQLARPAGTGFQAAADSVDVADSEKLIVYSATGVQVGDSFTLSAGLPQAAWGTYKVVAVTWRWVEFIATKPLPFDVYGNPDAAGLQFYPAAKRYIRVEADQSCVVRLNGDTGNTCLVDPWAPADADQTGWYEKCGAVWTAVVVNLSTAQLNLLLITAE
jgi:hypothetical protein